MCPATMADCAAVRALFSAMTRASEVGPPWGGGAGGCLHPIPDGPLLKENAGGGGGVGRGGKGDGAGGLGKRGGGGGD